MEQPAGDPEGRPQRQAEDDVADLADRGVGQHPLDVLLAEGQEGGRDHGECRQIHEDRGERRGQAEDVEEDPGQGVNARDLDQEAGQHGRYGRRGRRVGVGQPGVEGHEGRLQAEAHDEQGRAEADHVFRVQVLEPAGHGREAQASGDAEDDGDRDEDEGRGDDRKHEVLEGRLELVVLETEGDQGIGGHRRHFEEEVDIEQVGREDQAVHPGDHDQEEGPVVGLGPVMFHVVDRKDADAKPDEGHREEHEQAEAVEGQAEVDGLPEPGELLDERAGRGQLFSQEDRLDEEEEQDGVGQRVRQDPFRHLPQKRQDSGDHERQSYEEKNQRSSPLFQK